MSVRLDVTVSAVAWESGLDPDRVSQDLINIKRFINDTRREIAELPVRFSALEFSGEIVGVVNATAGTAAATLNKAEVTGTSTSWTTGMAGRYIKIDDQAWQRISYVTDTTHLTLDSSWNNTTVTAGTIKIWKRDYPLPAKVAKLLRVIPLNDKDRPAAMYDVSEFYKRYGFADTFDTPVNAYTQFGTQDLADAFIGSTIWTTCTITAGIPIADFTGVGMVTALAPGDRLLIGNATTSTAFYVDKVLTDLRVGLSHSPSISTGTTSATGHSLDRLNVRFNPAIDNTNVNYYEAYKKIHDLWDASDFIEEGWYNAVRKGAIAKAMGYVGNPKEVQKIKEYEIEIANLIRNQYKAQNPAFRFKVHIPYRYGQTTRFGTNRDEY